MMAKVSKGGLLIAVFGMGIVAAVSYLWWPSTNSKMIAACHEEIMERIPTPSTFRAVKTEVVDKAMTYQAWLAAQGRDEEADRKRMVELMIALRRTREEAEAEYRSKIPAQPVKRSILVQYDASNLMGAPIRSVFSCDHYLESSAAGWDKIKASIAYRRFILTGERLGVLPVQGGAVDNAIRVLGRH